MGQHGTFHGNTVLQAQYKCTTESHVSCQQLNVSNVLIGVTTPWLLLNTLHITCNFKCSFNLPLHMVQGPPSKPGQADK